MQYWSCTVMDNSSSCTFELKSITHIQIFLRNPTPEPVDAPNDLGEHIWDPYTFENTNYFYISNITVYQDQQYRQRDYAFWNEYMRYVAGDAFPIIMNSVLREFLSHEFGPPSKPDYGDWNIEILVPVHVPMWENSHILIWKDQHYTSFGVR